MLAEGCAAEQTGDQINGCLVQGTLHKINQCGRRAAERKIKMSKVAVVYWSGTGNTESMANAVIEGIESKGAEAVTVAPADFKPEDVAQYDAIAFGCPAMGAEQLEETEVQPMWDEVKGSLSGKKIGLFGSYGWGDGTWMHTWEDEANDAGANLVQDGVMANNEPDDDALQECRDLGAALA